MWKQTTALDQRSPGTTVQIHALNDVTFRIDKVDPFGRVVDGQSIRPIELRVADDTLTAATVDVGALNFCTRTAA